MTPGSAVRVAYVARHVTDCAMWPNVLIFATNSVANIKVKISDYKVKYSRSFLKF